MNQTLKKFTNSKVKVWKIFVFLTLAAIFACWLVYDRYLKNEFHTMEVANSVSFEPRKDLTLNDVTITIRTTRRFHDNRIRLQLRTWMKKGLQQTFVITDGDDKDLRKKLADGHLVVTKCGKSHKLADLCCKTSVEFDTFVQQTTSWWCRFDDDIYVNPHALVTLLNNYDPLKEFIYIGTQSRTQGLNARVLQNVTRVHYATGAGYCISRSLRNSLQPWVGDGRFVETCKSLKAPEDIAMGAVITVILKKPLIETFLFHSPYDRFTKDQLNVTDLKDQAMHSYGGKYKPNFDNYKVTFNKSEDPTRFLSIHCVLYPHDDICPMTSESTV